MQVRFSHNDQSETFGGGIKKREKRSVLQTAIELATGLTPVGMLPRIRVCWYDGICYCRTGIRRLAALYLATVILTAIDVSFRALPTGEACDLHLCKTPDEQWYFYQASTNLSYCMVARHLGHRIAPERVKYSMAQPVAVDEAFTHGVHGKRPKLTTILNGDHCRGKWIVIKETNQGIEHSQRRIEYGLDLLQLLLVCLQNHDADSSRGRC